jgi:hypothetical protein
MAKNKTQCGNQIAFDCDKYENCKECPGEKHKGPTTWPCKENINILLALSNEDKAVAFNKIVKRFVAAKDVRDIEYWIAGILEFYTSREIKGRSNL